MGRAGDLKPASDATSPWSRGPALHAGTLRAERRTWPRLARLPHPPFDARLARSVWYSTSSSRMMSSSPIETSVPQSRLRRRYMFYAWPPGRFAPAGFLPPLLEEIESLNRKAREGCYPSPQFLSRPILMSPTLRPDGSAPAWATAMSGAAGQSSDGLAEIKARDRRARRLTTACLALRIVEPDF